MPVKSRNIGRNLSIESATGTGGETREKLQATNNKVTTTSELIIGTMKNDSDDVKTAITKMNKEAKINKLTRHFQITKNELEQKRSSTLIINYKKPKENCFQKLPVLNPEGNFMTSWNLIILIFMLYTGIIMPFRICFVENDSHFWNTFETIIDFVFIADIFVSMNVSFKNSNNEIVTDRCEIIKNYLFSWFFIDLVSSLPQNLIFKNQKAQKGAKLIRIVKLTKLNRFIRFFRLFKVVRFLRKISFFNTFFDFIQLNYGASQLMMFIFFLLLLSHLISCLWYFLPKMYDEENYWVNKTGHINDSNYFKYLLSLYWTLATVFTVGFGDIHAYNSLEHIFSIIWMVFGVIFFSIIIGTLSSIISNSESRETKLKKKIMILDDFAQTSNLNPLLKKKIEFLLLFSARNEKISNDYTFLNTIPADLKVEVAKSVQNGFLKEIHFFTQYATPEFIAIIIQFLIPKNFLEKDVIYDEGDLPNCIYFILSGRIFFTKNNYAYCTYVKGSYFGEIDIMEEMRIHSTISATNCEFVALDKNCFVNVVMKNFQEIFRRIMKFAKVRKRRLKHLENRLNRYTKGELSVNISSRNLFNSCSGNYNRNSSLLSLNKGDDSLFDFGEDSSGIFSDYSEISSSIEGENSI